MSTVRYIIKRTGVSLGLIALVTSALFFAFRMMPGDFTSIFAQSGAGPETVERMTEKWGLDDPLYIQYLRYLENMLTADVGESFRFGTDVWELTKWRLLNSFILVGPAITVAYIAGGALGGFLGNRRGSKIEQWGVSGAVLIGAIPSFFTGIVLIIIFSSTLGWFPTGGAVSTETLRQLSETTSGNIIPFDYYQTTDFWWHYVLPFVTIFIKYLYFPTLIMRTNVVEMSGQGFMFYHRLSGISPLSELGKLIKHSSLPVITLYPVSMTRAIGGMVLVEVVFNWPGIGSLLIDSVLARDFPVVQFIFLLVAIWVILGNFAVDIIYGVIDPRVSVEQD
jgi:peptide/nickel transport system permease protein